MAGGQLPDKSVSDSADVFDLQERKWIQDGVNTWIIELTLVNCAYFAATMRPNLPDRLSRTSSVQIEDTFFLVGGYAPAQKLVHGGETTNKIYKFDNNLWEWEVLGAASQLFAPKADVAAFRVDSGLFPLECDSSRARGKYSGFSHLDIELVFEAGYTMS